MAISPKKYHKKDTSRSTSTKRGFDSIMTETVNGMPRRSQLLSRFIHQKSVAALSQFLSITIARPNAILFGALFSFTLTLLAYLLSKNLGYGLSGFESIGAFIVGWAIGILFDIVSPLLKKRK